MIMRYQGITLYHAMTAEWNETVVYDTSGMNMIGNKILLTIEGSFMSEAGEAGPYETSSAHSPNIAIDGDVSGVPGAKGSTPFNRRLNIALRNLSIPRGTFLIEDEVLGQTYFRAYPSEGAELLDELNRRNMDVNGGPKPLGVRVVQIYPNYARISFQIEVTKIRCLGGETEGGGGVPDGLGSDPTVGFVVSNRCWTDESLDANFYTTRSFHGQLRISNPDKSVHFYRHLYYPPLEDGFRRDSVRFSESEDGMTLTYEVTDKQVRNSAPYPATAFSGNVSYSVINGADMRLNLNITMIGGPDSPKSALVARALQAITNKIREFVKNGNTDGFHEKFNISENLGDPPSVTVDVGMRLVSGTSGTIGVFDSGSPLSDLYLGHLNVIGKPVEFDDFSDGAYVYSYVRSKSPKPNPYGYNVYSIAEDGLDESREDSTTAFIKCLATAPCAVRVTTEQMLENTEDGELDELGITKVVHEEGELEYAEKPSGAVEEAVFTPYSFYKSDIAYSTDYSRFALPRAMEVVKPPVLDLDGDITGAVAEQGVSGLYMAISFLGDGTGPAVASASGDVEGGASGCMIPVTMGEHAGVLSLTASAPIPLGNISGSASGTAVTGSITPATGDPVTFTGSILWITQQQRPDTNTRLVTLSLPIPKARVIIEAERFNRLPELPDPDEIITTTGTNPITFTCVKAETRLCEPRPARNSDSGVSYSVLGTYEYVMSREYQKGDEIWLLSNPTFQSSCYYPKVYDDGGNKVPNVRALKVLYHGKQLAHADYSAPPAPALPAPEPEPGP